MKRLWPFLLAVVVFLVLVLGILWRSYADRLPGAGRMCEAGLGVAGGASCQLAVATRDSVAKVTGAAAQFQVQAFNPLLGADVPFTCVRGKVLRCEGPTGEVVLIAP
ncbi:hypothetical protein GA0111570_103206 [Raineyella antarctica]|uniref:Uncharacterized protein n=1 Tax=Raineyella antarctica TaxID=1577474 RepID=A0A1G6GIR9_9ACTN|nr:hypothetical protein [Raineyella antarctica]SDB81076.1 hypothetical protein GA0111570_103206 [Raineyella antarctica]